MGSNHRRTIAISGATLALVLAGTVVASAHGGRGDPDGRGFGFGFGPGPGILEDGLGMHAPGLDRLRLGIAGDLDGLIRREVVVDLGEDGLVTQRVERGTVSAASETELTYALGTGETATVTIDEDTQVLSMIEADDEDALRPFRRQRLAVEEVALADVPANAGIVVWSQAEADGAFVAQRIVVQPADGADEATDDAAAAEDAAAAGVDDPTSLAADA